MKLENAAIGSVLILRFENMGDVNGDGHPDILVGHSGTNGIILDGTTADMIWSQPLVDKSWCVANIHDITWDGTNDAIIGTLYQDNRAYFLDGIDGETITSIAQTEAVDGINAIPDIVGDSTMEMVVGDRDGKVKVYSGGYDTTSSPVGIRNINPSNDPVSVRVFPNPSYGAFRVQVTCKQEENISFRISDMQGRSVMELPYRKYQAGSHEVPFDLRSACAAGVYILEIRHDAGTIQKKVVLTK
jgi:hypothetical protein